MSEADAPPGAGRPVRDRGVQALGELRIAVEATAALVGLIWLVQGINVLDGYRLDFSWGLEPRSLSSLPHILTMPFLHASMQHIESNTPPLAILAFLAALGGLKRFLYATVFVIVVGGLGLWLFGPSDTVTVGASGLIFGLLGFVVARGLFARKAWTAIWQIGLGAAVFIYYQWTLVLLYPSAVVKAENISWQGHLCGLLAGLLAAFTSARRGTRLDDAPAPVPAA